MKENKILSLLRKLSKKDLRQIELMVVSPFFNKKDNVKRYFNFLNNQAPQFEAEACSDELAFPVVYPGQTFQKKEISYLMSDLNKLIEQYLSWKQLKEDPFHAKVKLLHLYSEWDLDKSFNKTLRDAHKLLDERPFRSSEFFYNNFQLSSAENQHFDKQKTHKMDVSLQAAIDYLDLYYISQKLRYCCEVANRQNVVVSDYQIKLMDEVLSFLKDNPFEDQPSIEIYHAVLMGLAEEDEVHYQKLKALLELHGDSFSPDESRGMYIYAINYCVKKIHGGNRKYLAELFHLYKKTLEKQFMFDRGYISPWTYMNIVTVGTRTLQYEWTENFIKDYKKHLHEKFVKNAYNFNMAYLLFNKREFTKAQNLLIHVDFDDIFYISESKELLLRLYYETNEVEAFYSLADSFQVFIKRNKLISAQKKELYSNLIKYLKKLFRIEPGDSKSITRLKTSVEATRIISKKDWLLLKIQARLKQ